MNTKTNATKSNNVNARAARAAHTARKNKNTAALATSPVTEIAAAKGPQGPEIQPEVVVETVDLSTDLAPELPPVETVDGPEGPTVELPTPADQDAEAVTPSPVVEAAQVEVVEVAMVEQPAPEVAPAPAAAKVVKIKAPKPAKAPKVRRDYPFLTKAQISAQLTEDNSFVVRCLGILGGLQTADEQARKVTVYKNRCGFMASQAKLGTELAVKSQSAAGLEGSEMEKARALVLHYTRQLAVHFREEMIAERPELAELAKVFSAA